mmetsp:Transcript_78522/g.227914  ORF Transcript_78522/g.227914 Transcript_78522/m.227914 type:complete len:250 (-) Transcript_78522:1565-2314(-)
MSGAMFRMASHTKLPTALRQAAAALRTSFGRAPCRSELPNLTLQRHHRVANAWHSSHFSADLKGWYAALTPSRQFAPLHTLSPLKCSSKTEPTPNMSKQRPMKRSSPHACHCSLVLHSWALLKYVAMASLVNASTEPNIDGQPGPVYFMQFLMYTALPVCGESCFLMRSGRSTASGSALMIQSCACQCTSSLITFHAFMKTSVFAAVPSFEMPTFSHGGILSARTPLLSSKFLSLSTANSSHANMPTFF